MESVKVEKNEFLLETEENKRKVNGEHDVVHVLVHFDLEIFRSTNSIVQSKQNQQINFFVDRTVKYFNKKR
jgi:hypothetical protein